MLILNLKWRLIAAAVTLIVNLLATGAQARTSLQPKQIINRCLVAFNLAKSPTLAEQFFKENKTRWSEIEVDRARAMSVVRETLQQLVERNDLDQASKAQYWREIVGLMRAHLGIKFMSEEFQSTDGSILFQGAKMGVALVIGPNGELYRGQLGTKLDRKQSPPPIWETDLTGFLWLNPPRDSATH